MCLYLLKVCYCQCATACSFNAFEDGCTPTTKYKYRRTADQTHGVDLIFFLFAKDCNQRSGMMKRKWSSGLFYSFENEENKKKWKYNFCRLVILNKLKTGCLVNCISLRIIVYNLDPSALSFLERHDKS